MLRNTGLLLLLGLMSLSWPGNAQRSWPMIREAEMAYEKGTRSLTGAPGARYFQNYSDYSLDVTLQPKNRLITGKGTITYHNQSPDTLTYIVMRFYQDFYKKGASRAKSCAPEDIHNGMQLHRLEWVKGETRKPLQSVRTQGTNRFFRLPEPLAPGQNLQLAADWEFTMPETSKIRYGSYDSTTFFVGYWYPQIAVYDDIRGWDVQRFSGEAEFYNDFSNFDVRIAVPGQQVVWATGELQNADEVLPDNILRKLKKARQTDEVIQVMASTDARDLLPETPQVWHFQANQVTDFAFATSDHCRWDATSTPAGPHTQRRVLANAVYRVPTKDFHEVARITRESVRMLSHSIMGVEFPFPHMTVFSGGTSGMEFPMMANDAEADQLAATAFVTSHEVAHSYFPFLVGTNEKYEAWMDEGLITMLPKEIEMELVENHDPYIRLMRGFSRWAGSYFEVPLHNPSFALRGYSYSFHAYSRSGAAFYTLREYLGRETFHQALKTFIQRWQYKHPTGYDLMYTFEDVAGEDLGWFWNPWFFTFGYPDIAITDVQSRQVTLSRQGVVPIPVQLTVTFTDGSQTTLARKLDVWKNQSEVVLEVPGQQPIEKMELGSPYIPDSKPGNNHWKKNKS